MNTAYSTRRSDYEYPVPKELIAQEPLPVRDQSRLLVLQRKDGTMAHRRFADLADYLIPGDCLVLNRTRVLPARLYGKKESGGKVEVLFLDIAPLKNGTSLYRALVRPFIDEGKKILLPGGLTALVKGKTPENETLLELCGTESVRDVLESRGHMPLPPYIKRSDDGLSRYSETDRKRYQTVYSMETGSVAAPTAGLHFTQSLLEAIQAKGIAIAEIVLHVGWGTFKPLVSDDVRRHRMLPEAYEIGDDARDKIERCIVGNRRIIAVGTTTVRALESAAQEPELPKGPRETSIFIYPGYGFKLVNALITNFHQPCSTPLLMACAFAGRDTLFKAYDEAIRQRYRLFSYGDAMMML